MLRPLMKVCYDNVRAGTVQVERIKLLAHCNRCDQKFSSDLGGIYADDAASTRVHFPIVSLLQLPLASLPSRLSWH